MAKVKTGRPMLNEKPRDKRVSIKVTEEELERLREVAVKNNLIYWDILLKGIEYFEKK